MAASTLSPLLPPTIANLGLALKWDPRQDGMGSARGFPACGERPHRRFPDQKGVFSGPFSRWTCGGITHQAPHGPILGILPRSICWGWIGWPVPNDRWRSPA